jgi:hypothetical protein
VKGKRVAKGQMSRGLVRLCMGVLVAAAVWGAALKSVRPEADLSDVLTFVGAAFGGELMMLLCKRVFARERTESEGEDNE